MLAQQVIQWHERPLRDVHVVVVRPRHSIDDILDIASSNGQLLFLVIRPSIDRVELQRHVVLGAQDLVDRILHDRDVGHWGKCRVAV